MTATVSMGFPFADIRDAGVSALVTGDGDGNLARDKADELAGWLWELRDKLQPKLTKIAGFEWGSGFYINPTPPEVAAKYMRETEI